MWFNCQKVEELNSELVDFLCNSEGNFVDVPIDSYGNGKQVDWENLNKLINEKYCIVECDEISHVNRIYQRMQANVKQINLDILNNISCIEELLDICRTKIDDMYKSGLFLSESNGRKLLLENPPTKTMSIIDKNSNIEDICDELGIQYVFALTRLYEDEGWHNAMYKLYAELEPNYFEEKEIEIIYIKKEHLSKEYANLEKAPVWEDKIMGAIFIFNIDDSLDSLSVISKFYHYVMELYLHSSIVRNYKAYEDFSDRFIRYFLQSENDTELFFEPHCLIEAYCWRYAEKMLHDLLKNFGINLDKMNNTLIYKKEECFITENNIDAISNHARKRKFPGRHRMFSMDFKYELFSSMVLKKSNFVDYIIVNAE